MKKVTIKLSADWKDHFANVVKPKLSAEVVTYEKAVNSNSDLIAKERELSEQIKQLESEIDPLDEAQVEKLIQVRTQQFMIAKRLEPTGNDVDQRIKQRLSAITRGAGANIADALQSTHRDACAVVAEALRPFWNSDGDAMYAARGTHFVQNFAAFIGTLGGLTQTYEAAKQNLKYIDLLLEGKSPFKFKFAAPVPGLEIFAD
jgi:TolA-binding protein